MPTVQRPEPPYQQIVEDIRRQIRSGELHDGDLVPSTRQLARDWQRFGPNHGRQGPTTLRPRAIVRGVAVTGTVVCAGTTHIRRR